MPCAGRVMLPWPRAVLVTAASVSERRQVRDSPEPERAQRASESGRGWGPGRSENVRAPRTNKKMDLAALKIFLAVAQERSFSRAAAKVHRTQPAVSQAVRRLEVELGEQLFDRSSKTGTLTEAGRMLQNYGQRLVRLAEETESAVRELRDLRRGRVLIGANEAAVHTLLPLITRFRSRYPDIAIDVRRVPARQIAVEVQQGSLHFRALTFHPQAPGLLEVPVGSDELVLLVWPRHPLASRRQVTMEEVGAEAIVAHNQPSPPREAVLCLFEP